MTGGFMNEFEAKPKRGTWFWVVVVVLHGVLIIAGYHLLSGVNLAALHGG
jgi:hypothetical protein